MTFLFHCVVSLNWHHKSLPKRFAAEESETRKTWWVLRVPTATGVAWDTGNEIGYPETATAWIESEGTGRAHLPQLIVEKVAPMSILKSSSWSSTLRSRIWNETENQLTPSINGVLSHGRGKMSLWRCWLLGRVSFFLSFKYGTAVFQRPSLLQYLQTSKGKLEKPSGWPKVQEDFESLLEACLCVCNDSSCKARAVDFISFFLFSCKLFSRNCVAASIVSLRDWSAQPTFAL